MKPRLQRWLGARHAPLVVAAIGLALAAPALTAGFVADDHLHRILGEDDPGVPGIESRPFDLFVFASGDRDDMRALQDVGMMPWWADPGAKLAFMRPVSSATHALDHALWPDSATLQLAHNLVWLAIALLAVWAFYRRFIDVRWLAVLALLLYAVDDARGPPVGWIANRNAFVALALAIPVLLFHDRWRREGWQPGRYLGPALLAVALLAGESALAICAYLGAHAFHIDRAPWRERILALVPYVVVVIAWRAAYDLLGYGVAHSGIYIDPRAEPFVFAEAAAHRYPLLLLGQLGLPWSDLATLYPLGGDGLVWTMVAVALGALAVIAFAAWPLLRDDPVSRFFATGMLLATVPICSTFPADRLLGFVGLGAMGLVARLLGAALYERRLLGRHVARRAVAVGVAIVLTLVHVVASPVFLASRSRSMVMIGVLFDRADATIPSSPDIVDATVVLANTPADPFGGYIPIMRASRGEPRPAYLRWLVTGASDVTYERTGPRRLRVVPDEGFLRYPMDHMLRSPSRPFAAGDRVELTGFTAVIEQVTTSGRPLAVEFVFDRPLEDPQLVWLHWGEDGYEPWTPPALGDSARLEAIDFVELVFEKAEQWRE